MKKYVCTVCGYIAEGTIPSSAPSARLPLPHSSRRPATPTSPSMLWASARPRRSAGDRRWPARQLRGRVQRGRHVLGNGSRAEREGYPEIAEAYKRYAYEEADHASRFAELLGEVVTDSTKKNLMMRAEAECGACSGRWTWPRRLRL